MRKPTAAKCSHFVQILRDGQTPLAGYRDGVASLVLAEAAALSVKRNAVISVASV